MNHDDLDRLMSREQEVIPSSGFAASVMDAVRIQAQAPPPIPFPWKRAVPGMAAALLSLVWIIFACFTVFSSNGDGSALAVKLPHAILPLWHAAFWLSLALITTVGSLAFSFRFVSRIA